MRKVVPVNHLKRQFRLVFNNFKMEALIVTADNDSDSDSTI